VSSLRSFIRDKELYVITGALLLAVTAFIIYIFLIRPTKVMSLPGPVNPSESAKMVCTQKSLSEIGLAIGVYAIAEIGPSWNVSNHIYSCTLLYNNYAKITLSVKELLNTADTTDYFNYLSNVYGRTLPLSLGQGGFYTKNGSVVVRKDFKVLYIDVSHLPQQFGPASASNQTGYTRQNDAGSIAGAILNCWNGN
jgi:hypothetical protein